MSEDPTRLLPNDDMKVAIAQLQATMIVRFDALSVQITELRERQAALEEKVDRRLQDTRSIWEAVLARLELLEARLDAFDKRQSKFEEEIIREIKRMRRDFMSVWTLLQDSHTDLRVEVEERLTKLEERTAA